MLKVNGSLQARQLKWQRFTALIFLALILASLLGATRSPVAAVLARGERIPILIFGVDAADSSRHTDTLMLGLFEPVKNYISVLSIPRDTRIDLPGYRFKRINEIYGYNLRKSKDVVYSSQKVLEGVTHLLSSSDFVPLLPYFVQIDFSGFNRTVDLLGGVWVEVKTPMHYDDYAGNYHFHKEPGRYLMKGQEALHYVRFRGQTGDRGRIFRQQEFIRSALRRLANPVMILRLPELIGIIKSTIRSNMSFWDVFYLASACRRVRSDDVGFYVLPGQVSGVFWYPKKSNIEQLVSLLFLGRLPVGQVEETIVPQSGRITVKVWNASGKSGAGYEMTKFLRQAGYDVIDWGNYGNQQLQTRVIDRMGQIENAKLVAATMGVENYHSEPNPKALVDVDVVIGQNYMGTTVP
ncbi:MAG: Transcriptional regulator LytR [Elusimicrobia bacterium]|nr:Transcriptional regulator LytR [Elusimicrobiota bacterium]